MEPNKKYHVLRCAVRDSSFVLRDLPCARVVVTQEGSNAYPGLFFLPVGEYRIPLSLSGKVSLLAVGGKHCTVDGVVVGEADRACLVGRTVGLTRILSSIATGLPIGFVNVYNALAQLVVRAFGDVTVSEGLT